MRQNLDFDKFRPELLKTRIARIARIPYGGFSQIRSQMFNTWIQETLSKTTLADDDLEVGEQDTEVNLDYELADTL